MPDLELSEADADFQWRSGRAVKLRLVVSQNCVLENLLDGTGRSRLFSDAWIRGAAVGVRTVILSNRRLRLLLASFTACAIRFGRRAADKPYDVPFKEKYRPFDITAQNFFTNVNGAALIVTQLNLSVIRLASELHLYDVVFLVIELCERCCSIASRLLLYLTCSL